MAHANHTICVYTVHTLDALALMHCTVLSRGAGLPQYSRGQRHSSPNLPHSVDPFTRCTRILQRQELSEASQVRVTRSRVSRCQVPQQRGHQATVLPQEALTSFKSLPMLCINPTSAGVCSARDFHNKKVSNLCACHLPLSSV